MIRCRIEASGTHGERVSTSDERLATTDQRVLRSKDRVLQETYRLLTEAGMAGVSVDEVSRRSGVAKTTIYRHWPTRSALLLDACSKMGVPAPAPDTGDLRADIGVLATRVADQLNHAPWPSVLPSIIDAAERDPDVAALHAKLHAGNMQPFFLAIEEGKRRGELDPDRDASILVAAIIGPLFYRRWFSKESIDEAFVACVVNQAFA